MADDDGQKTEEPTARRREEARRQGQIAQSPELTTAFLLLAAAISLWMFGSGITLNLKTAAEEYIGNSHAILQHVGAQELLEGAVRRGIGITGGMVAVLFTVGLLVSIGQVGFLFSVEALEFKWDRLDPIAGMGKILSIAGFVKGLQQLVKILVVGIVATWIIWGREGFIASFVNSPLPWVASQTWGLAMQMLTVTSVFLVVLGSADYAYQFFRVEKQLKMSKSELKDEHRNEEGDPQVKARRRQIARELSQKRKMIADLPKATVLITNPTHFAIALRYDRSETPAPVCLAKGKDHFALRLIEEAKKLGIPVIERKPLAQALYKLVNVGDEIPHTLYIAVSEVLAYLWKLRGRVD